MVEHSMSYALAGYVRGKIPVAYLHEAFNSKTKVIVFGIFRDQFLDYCAYHHWFIEEIWNQPLWTSEKSSNLDSTRAELFRAINNQKSNYVLLVPPGRDITKQYGFLVRNYLDSLDTSHSYCCQDTLEVQFKELTTAKYKELSQFDNIPHDILTNQTVILGYTEKFRENLQSRFKTCTIDRGYFSIYFFEQQNVVLFGVKHSYWGDLVQHVTECILQAKPKQIIFTGKCGIITKSTRFDLFRSFFTPNSIYLKNKILDVHNSLARRLAPKYTSSHHFTVETVMEETYDWRDRVLDIVPAQDQYCLTVDNEIGYIATQIYQYNRRSTKKVEFGAIVIPTDYVRSKDEAALVVNQDLEVNRVSDLIKKNKKIVIDKMIRALLCFLEDEEYVYQDFKYEDDFAQNIRLTFANPCGLLSPNSNYLLQCAKAGKYRELGRFFEINEIQYESVNATYKQKSLLYHACRSQNINTIKTLLLHGAKIDKGVLGELTSESWRKILIECWTLSVLMKSLRSTEKRTRDIAALRENWKELGFDKAHPTETKELEKLTEANK
jgi:hypothetical protein